MGAARLLALVSVCLFIVAAFVFTWAHGGNARLVEDLTLLGLATLAAAHAV
jgi:hypothetical protein